MIIYLFNPQSSKDDDADTTLIYINFSHNNKSWEIDNESALPWTNLGGNWPDFMVLYES
jgi:hypothetical protein